MLLALHGSVKPHVNSPSVHAYVVHLALTIHLVSLPHFIMTLGRVGESSVLLSAMSRFRASATWSVYLMNGCLGHGESLREA